MIHMRTVFLSLLIILIVSRVNAQNAGRLNAKPWTAFWIAVPNQPEHDYGVYHFRKSFELTSKPAQFIVHVSGDNRYKLYINGQLASFGPARGDIFHWYYETVDLAPFLQSGRNTVAAVVWNDGAFRPEAQISFRTAFILQGQSAAEEVLNTNKSWKAIKDSSYQPLRPQLINTFYVTGPGEMKDNRLATADWLQSGFNDAAWSNAQEIFHGLPKGVFEWTEGWMLLPRPIPQMELTPQRLNEVRKAEGVTVPEGFPKNKTAFTIPANTKASVLLDQSFLTNAYSTLVFSKGRDAQISMAYAEALYIDEGNTKDWRNQNQKGNRNEVEGKRFAGKEDRVISNGSNNQQYTPLWWRTYRYLQLKVET
ncbi:MAG: alpha-L-rhamnosidase N-terminal domain-containing protein, partial [Flavisolibacter sp.]|nr:alpha-L-rhamnosidase N-terminal domain-containing protein [Flavisolibacter sp.]